MKSLWRHLARLFLRQARAGGGAANASLMSAAALRALRFPRQHVELFELELFGRYVLAVDDRNPLFHMSHRHYLSASFGWRDRVAAALTHHRFEDRRYRSAYKEAVYRQGGIELWSQRPGETQYELRLRANRELRHEGGLSVVLLADGEVVCEMSYAWVGGAVFGLADVDAVPLVTRNQSLHHDAPASLGFRRDFPQNSPMYFCLAAMHGIVQAHGMAHLAGIRHDLQVAFESRYAEGFRHSYCDLWRAFGSVEAGDVGYLMPVPPRLPDVSTLAAKHRKRAIDRRRRWAEIGARARDAVAPHVEPRGSRTATPKSPPREPLASVTEMHATLLMVATLVA